MAEQPLHGMRVLVTRPVHQARSQIERLHTLGAEAVALPLLEIVPVTEAEHVAFNAIKSKILDLDLYTGVIFVSPNAARIGGQWIDAYWPQLPIGVHWLAIGAATADSLEACGIPAHYVNGGYDSEALLCDPLLQQVAEQRFLIMRGEGGRELLADTLRARGAQVDYADLYRRTCPRYSPDLIKRTIFAQGLSAILITSGEALSNLLELAGTEPDLLSTELIVPSQRIAAIAEARGFTRIRIADGPDDTSMIRALRPAD
ncbi:uroporphyrinogen-III synthase [Marinobacterium zhoushanense]|uniref:Uroporphyrinogen-III synthase n=1 Tax=Marinobacterium zhoushanense TaxID=1679163 RepID=A0ABQ1KW97_9GAMM|nr:uroporphyrinogen-III synthase [Marinobacterium zhoushanense]GGC09580.1 uroporphyrinogen-III synthase [Marinobacterium zhoushanense]